MQPILSRRALPVAGISSAVDELDCHEQVRAEAEIHARSTTQQAHRARQNIDYKG